MLLVRAGRLIDGTGQTQQGVAILIEGERIVRVTKAEETEHQEDGQVIDALDKTVLPGLVDAHVHLRGSGDPDEQASFRLGGVNESVASVALKCYVNARRDLEAGFTAVRDMGCRDYADVAVRDAIEAGMLEGPRMKVAGEALATTGGHLDLTVKLGPHVQIGKLMNIADSPDEGRRAARQQIKMGADLIKISATQTEYVRQQGGLFSQEMTSDTMSAICEVAHWAGRRVAAHCHGGNGVRDAILAGVDTLEHGRFLTDELIEMMVEHDVYLVPTLSPEARVMEQGQEASGRTDESWSWFLRAYEVMYETVRRAYQKGVKIAAGSDAAMPFVRHGQNAYELEQLTRAGLTPMEALVAATRIGAEALGMEQQIGTVEEGKLADLIVVDGDPLTDITVLQEVGRIRHVIKGGEIVINRT
jgi:imidazolonepropionase-like amidohydrolase